MEARHVQGHFASAMFIEIVSAAAAVLQLPLI